MLGCDQTEGQDARNDPSAESDGKVEECQDKDVRGAMQACRWRIILDAFLRLAELVMVGIEASVSRHGRIVHPRASRYATVDLCCSRDGLSIGQDMSAILYLHRLNSRSKRPGNSACIQSTNL